MWNSSFNIEPTMMANAIRPLSLPTSSSHFHASQILPKNGMVGSTAFSACALIWLNEYTPPPPAAEAPAGHAPGLSSAKGPLRMILPQ